MRLLLLVALCGLMDAAQSFAPGRGLVAQTSGVTLAAGFVLLAGFLGGSLFHDIRLPRLTGYLATGILIGPHVLDLVSGEMVQRLRLFGGIAVSLIALTAGAEMDLRSMRSLFRSISWITALAVGGSMAAIAGAMFLMRDQLDFLARLGPVEAALIAVTFGVMLAAQSPAVVVALRDEMRAEGPLTRTVLGVVVLSDLVIIVMFALASSVTQRFLSVEAPHGGMVNQLTWEIFGSLGIGVVLGMLIALYLKVVSARASLTVVVMGYLVAEIGERVNLDPLLLALGAGMFVRNMTSHGERLLREVHSATMPIYVMFFALAGAGVHLDVLPVLAAPISVFLLVRGLSMVGGASLAGRVADAPAVVRRYAGFGLLPQAGLALALAVLFSRTFPSLGPEASALVFGVVAMNELVSPVLYRWALLRSGESGQGEPGEGPAPAH